MFKKIIIAIILNAAALYGVTVLLPDIRYSGGFLFFLIGGGIMGILNAIVKPILKLLTLPFQILTMGLSLIVINGIIFWLFHFIIDTIAIETVSMQIPIIKTYFLAGFIFGIINYFEHMLISRT